MTSFCDARLQGIQLFAIALSLVSAGFSSAAVMVDFRGTGFTNPGPATATVTLSDLENDPVTLSSPDQGGVFLDVANDSFADNDGYTGEINLVLSTGTVGAGGLANWDVTIDPNGRINGNSPNGWGVGTGDTGNASTNSQISGNELLLFTVDTNFTTTGMNKFIFASARVGGGSWEIWHRTGATSGIKIISNNGPADVAPVDTFELTDGDMFAIQSVDGTNNRLRTLTFDIIVPEPAVVGLVSLGLGGLLTIMRRRRD